jgi:Bacteriocin-protection, YdeI or OmpD-Associated
MLTKFKAVIFKRWIMRCVAVPKAALKAQAQLTHPPVIVTLLMSDAKGEKETWDTTLAPQDAAHWALVIPVALLKARGLEVGSEVQLEIEYDPERAPPEMPADIEAALRARPGVYARFRSITVPWQRQMIRYVDKGKSPDTREKYIEILIERVNEHALKVADKKVVKKPVRKAATKR